MSFSSGSDILVPNYRRAEARAETLTAAYTSPPIPVLEIAEQSGVDVEFTRFRDLGDRIAGFCDFGARKLYVNDEDIVSRQTFTIAHELGHWVLHRELYLEDPERYRGLPRYQQPDQKDPLEQEANCFAANLLVPRRLIGPVRYAPVSELTDVFAVSRKMMEYRLKNVR